TIQFNGFNNQARTITVSYDSMHNVFRDTTWMALDPAHLFLNLNGGAGAYDPTVVSSVQLPNHQSYFFKYNQWGEIAQVTLPTGGALEYDFTTLSATQGDIQVDRRLTERRTYPNGPGTTFESKTSYAYNANPSGPPFTTTATVSHYDSSSNLL